MCIMYEPQASQYYSDGDIVFYSLGTSSFNTFSVYGVSSFAYHLADYFLLSTSNFALRYPDEP